MGGHEVKISREEQSAGREGRVEQPSPGGQDVWEAGAPAKLLPLIPSNSFLSLVYPFAMRYRELSGLCPVCGSGVRWENTTLADIRPPCLPRVVN